MFINYKPVFTGLLIAGVILIVAALPSPASQPETSGADDVAFPALLSLDGLSDPSLAFGVDSASDWAVSMPYLNIAKMGRPWVGHLPSQNWGGFDYKDFVAGGYLDQSGYPLRIPSEVKFIEMVFDWSNNSYGSEKERIGRYIFTYDGEGDISIASAKIVSKKSGRMVFDTKGFFSIKIKSTDPNKTGNNLRNFVIVREDRLPLYEAGAIFNPSFIDSIKDARHLRFMGAMNINNSPIREWSEYTSKNHFSWKTMPVSVMVELANEVGSDPWFTMPFHADEDFIRRFAEYVRDNLDSELVARVELSNEVWNFGFRQAHDAATLATSRYGTDEGAAWIQYYAERTAKIMSIWSEVYGNEARIRLRRVLGAFAPNPWMANMALNAEHWRRVDPDGYYPPHTVIDEVAITTYFGYGSIANESSRAALLAAIANPDVNEFDWHRDQLMSEIQKGLAADFTAMKNLADRYKIKVVAYEGGQHVHHSFGVDIPRSELDALQDHLVKFVRSTQMAELYEACWNVWQETGQGPYMQLHAVAQPGAWGSWGMLASYADSTPVATFLTNKNKATPAWWESRGGDHFKQGRRVASTSKTLVGTAAEDFLIGGNGDDLIYAGPGDDGLNGGPGEDTAMFRGNRSDYIVKTEGMGYRVVGPDGSDYVFAVEYLYFEDNTRISLASVQSTD